MTVLRLLSLRSPADFADWFRVGAEYVRDVTDGMGFDVAPAAANGGSAVEDAPTYSPASDLDALVAAGVDAMRDGRTDVDPRVGRLIAADLLADAAFADPFCQWTPLWYELALAPFNALAERRLRAVARQYARGIADGDPVGSGSGAGTGSGPGSGAPPGPDARSESTATEVPVPRFSRPRDVIVDGGSPVAGMGADPTGFARRFVLADALVHLEWYVHVAREAGVVVPDSLVARTRRETLRYWTGPSEADALSPDVRQFQALLFADDAWVRGIDESYGLESRLLSVWERLCRREREALEAGEPSPVWS